MPYLILILIACLTTTPIAPAFAQSAAAAASNELTLKISRSPLTRSEVDQYVTTLDKLEQYIKANPKDWRATLGQGETGLMRLWSKMGIKSEDMTFLSAKINLAGTLADNAAYVADLEKNFKLKEEALAKEAPNIRTAMRKRMDMERDFIRNLKKTAPETLKIYKTHKTRIDAATQRLNRQMK